MWVRRILPLGSANQVSSLAEARAQFARDLHRCPAEVVEVQMGCQHDVDRLGRQPDISQRMIECSRAAWKYNFLARSLALAILASSNQWRGSFSCTTSSALG